MDEKAATAAAKLAEERGIQIAVDRQAILMQAEEDMIGMGNADEAELEERELKEEEDIEKEKETRKKIYDKREEEFDKKIREEMLKAAEDLDAIMIKRGRREGTKGGGRAVKGVALKKIKKRKRQRVQKLELLWEDEDGEAENMQIDF